MELLRQETDKLKHQGLNIERRVALSREVGEPQQYVQELVAQDGEIIYKRWMEEDGVIFVCGKVAMAEDIGLALRKILEKFGKLDTEQALKVMKVKKSQGSYQLDLFG